MNAEDPYGPPVLRNAAGWPRDAVGIEIAPNVFAPSFIEMSDSRADSASGDFKILSRLVLKNFAYVVKEFSVVATGEAAVTGALLRTIPLLESAEYAIQSSIRWVDDQKVVRVFDFQEVGWLWEKKPTEHTLTVVARLYAASYAMNASPTRAVVEVLDLKRSTAENWIRRAKDKGYIYAATE